MSERVTPEQVYACLDVVDTFNTENYDQRLTTDEQQDQEYTLFSFTVHEPAVPQFVLDTMIAPPFSGATFERQFAVDVERTVPLSDTSLLYDEALIVGFFRKFQSNTLRGTSELRCILGYPDSEGSVKAQLTASLSANVRDHDQERHQEALDRVMYHAQLDNRLQGMGLPPSERTPERDEAEGYVQYVLDNGITFNHRSTPVDPLPFLGSREKELLDKGGIMSGEHVQALCTVLGSITIFGERTLAPTSYEALARRFGTKDEL